MAVHGTTVSCEQQSACSSLSMWHSASEGCWPHREGVQQDWPESSLTITKKKKARRGIYLTIVRGPQLFCSVLFCSPRGLRTARWLPTPHSGTSGLCSPRQTQISRATTQTRMALWHHCNPSSACVSCRWTPCEVCARHAVQRAHALCHDGGGVRVKCCYERTVGVRN
jgi:hypothetical protein